MLGAGAMSRRAVKRSAEHRSTDASTASATNKLKIEVPESTAAPQSLSAIIIDSTLLLPQLVSIVVSYSTQFVSTAASVVSNQYYGIYGICEIERSAGSTEPPAIVFGHYSCFMKVNLSGQFENPSLTSSLHISHLISVWTRLHLMLFDAWCDTGTGMVML